MVGQQDGLEHGQAPQTTLIYRTAFQSLLQCCSTYINTTKGTELQNKWKGKSGKKDRGIKYILFAVQTRQRKSHNLRVTFSSCDGFECIRYLLLWKPTQRENKGSFAPVMTPSCLRFTMDGLRKCPFGFVHTYMFVFLSLS